MRNGIVVAGYIGVDVLKEITGFPGPHDLVNIESVGLALGGLVSNCARDLALLEMCIRDRRCTASSRASIPSPSSRASARR